MASRKRLVIGLGNPSAEYASTRHNVGFAVVDLLAERARVSFRLDPRARALAAEVRIRSRPVLLVKPQTYMNRSGFAAKNLMRRLQIAPTEILVVVDDINLPLGNLRLRAQGSAGGHNGVQDIIDEIASDAFPRLRLGVGGDFGEGQQSNYVLSPFTAQERPMVDQAVKRASQAAVAFVTDGITHAMNRFNRRSGAGADSVTQV